MALRDAQQAWYPAKLANTSGASYVYTTNFLTKLKALGIVAFQEEGRTKRVLLTEQGVNIAVALDALMQKLEAPKQVSVPPAPPAPAPAAGEDRAIV